MKGTSWGDEFKLVCKFSEEIPLNSIMWKPRVHSTKHQVWYYVNVIFLHLLPGLLIDGLLKICGKKPLYVNTHCVIYVNIFKLLIMLYLPVTGIT
jgi:hypothetical protein